jgi:hypothetical protein
MGLIDSLRAAGEGAAARARETIQESQLKAELERAYAELGRVSFALVSLGSLSDERLVACAGKIRLPQSRLTQGGEGDSA